ncbi:MAG: hypothetical protein LOY03_07995 [Cyclobacteriaceae bacterium]|nr:hypothetical protein [Cyclobacteriaceae bacterium]
MPIHNYILTTEPLARERADALIPNREAVADSRFVVHYWRLTRDRRLLMRSLAAMEQDGALPVHPVLKLSHPHATEYLPQLALH